MGLCFYLAFWTAGDPNQMDRLFRNSGLMRGKWDKVHFANGATYGEVCLSRTLLQVNDYYSPPAKESESDDSAPTRSHSDGEPAFESSPTTANVTDVRAVEDAKRLASKVQHQQRELQAQRERIHALETRLQWYRQVLGVPSSQDAPYGADHDVEGPLESTTDGSDSGQHRVSLNGHLLRLTPIQRFSRQMQSLIRTPKWRVNIRIPVPGQIRRLLSLQGSLPSYADGSRERFSIIYLSPPNGLWGVQNRSSIVNID